MRRPRRFERINRRRLAAFELAFGLSTSETARQSRHSFSSPHGSSAFTNSPH
jgi:hypothetical protein